MRRLTLIGPFALVLNGCVGTTQLPLCPSIAHKSFQNPADASDINFYISQNAVARGVNVRQISSFLVELRGSHTNMAWIRRNYPSMLCSFRYEQVLNGQETYLSCMSHAPEWMETVRKKKPADLFLNSTLYRANCAAESHG